LFYDRDREILAGDQHPRMGEKWPVTHDVCRSQDQSLPEINAVPGKWLLEGGSLDNVDCVDAQGLVISLCMQRRGDRDHRDDD